MLTSKLSQMSFWFLFFMAIFSFKSDHEYYYTITELNFKPENKQMEVAIKMAAHDIEYIFNKKKFCSNTNIHCDNLSALDEECITDYICSNFEVKIKDKYEILEFVGQEYENEGYIYFYFVINNISKKIKSFELSNTIFFETYSHQKNITHFEYYNKTGEKGKHSFYFSPNQPKQTFNINH